MHASDPAPAYTGGYLEKRNRHPGTMIAAIAIHAGIVGAILTYNPEIIGVKPEPIPLIPIAKPEEPIKPAEERQRKPAPETDPMRDPPIVTIRPIDPVKPVWPDFPPQPPMEPAGDGGTGTGTTTADPPPPVLIGIANDPRFARDMQPPYPPALERMEVEGFAKVRVQVGTDGRVTAVEEVESSDPAFFASTRDWALRKWRFKPATRDGVAVTGWLTRTVTFRIVR